MSSASLGRLLHNRTPGEALVVIGAMVGFAVAAGYGCYFCYGTTYDRSLLRGKNVIYQMTGEATLEKAGFYEAHPQGGAAEFVAFVDDDDHPLWPMTDRQYRDQFAHPDLVDSPSRSLMPGDLEFVAGEVDTEAGRQIVYRPGDDGDVLRLEGYVDPGGSPMYEWTLEFPSDADEIDL